MPMWDATDATNHLKAGFGVSAYTTVTGIKLRLGTTTPTATSNMTELTGTGYTAGGTTVTWTSPSTQNVANVTAPSWTNGSGSAWAVQALETWDIAGTPLRHAWGVWTGAPIAVANGNTLNVAAAAVVANEA
jgi:hypothetical protein